MAAGFKMCRENRPESPGKNRTLSELMGESSVELRFEITKP